VLITPKGAPAENHFSTLSCAGISAKIEGSGLIGEITSPKCGVASSMTTLTFASTSPGNQAWTQITTSGTIYDLSTTVLGGNSTFSMDAVWTFKFPQAQTAECT